ncbi:hypothetical protein HHI36_008813 [Cryptolaemus montrouzieri]|uniref:Uncharacterized protein n=1 Tax=Cryptolaemus montrouzieri TaxID=559131 RepID=A0ABD2MTN3_9CUCU
MKEIVNQIVSPLSHLVNKKMQSGTVPKLFKVGIIKPLHKGGDKKIMSDYCPITLIVTRQMNFIRKRT